MPPPTRAQSARRQRLITVVVMAVVFAGSLGLAYFVSVAKGSPTTPETSIKSGTRTALGAPTAPGGFDQL